MALYWYCSCFATAAACSAQTEKAVVFDFHEPGIPVGWRAPRTDPTNIFLLPLSPPERMVYL